jgi:hypothetical protein
MLTGRREKRRKEKGEKEKRRKGVFLLARVLLFFI